MFKLRYLDGVKDDGNAFAQYGTLCHTLLEEWARGSLVSFELADEFRSRYDKAVAHYFPPYPRGMGQKYYDAGLQYFTTFDGFGGEYEIVTTEDRFTIDVHGYLVVGVIDLVLRDVATGGLVVVDHKSKSKRVMRKQLGTYRRQLYLYASAIQERFGEAPTTLSFNLFREGIMMDEPYDASEHAEVLRWVVDTIRMIENEKQWPAKPSHYFCENICPCAPHCLNIYT